MFTCYTWKHNNPCHDRLYNIGIGFTTLSSGFIVIEELEKRHVSWKVRQQGRCMMFFD